jgi:hypothetical protein
MKVSILSRLVYGMALGLVFAVAATVASAQIVATGGDVVYDVQDGDTPYRVHVYTNAGAASFDTETLGNIDILLVGGGGGGGFDGGGGGAGGFVLSSMLVQAGSNYTVVVGAGGAGRTAVGATGEKGQDSRFGSATATGGGGGGSGAMTGQTGGSGGGAGRATSIYSGGTATEG